MIVLIIFLLLNKLLMLILYISEKLRQMSNHVNLKLAIELELLSVKIFLVKITLIICQKNCLLLILY